MAHPCISIMHDDWVGGRDTHTSVPVHEVGLSDAPLPAPIKHFRIGIPGSSRCHVGFRPRQAAATKGQDQKIAIRHRHRLPTATDSPSHSRMNLGSALDGGRSQIREQYIQGNYKSGSLEESGRRRDPMYQLGPKSSWNVVVDSTGR